MQGETLAYTLTEKTTPYIPRLYFNSAKFFDIEYQVYGEAPAALPAGRSWFVWQHPRSDRAIRLYWDSDTQALTGVHLMGVRYRQEVCEAWILGKTTIDEVVADLRLANFDPEFFEDTELPFLKAYNAATGKTVQLKSKRSLPAVQRFLRAFRIGRSESRKTEVI